MGNLTGTSTYTEVREQYDDNACYDIENDIPQCKLFIEAARILMRRQPSSAAKSGNSVGKNMTVLKDELDAAVEWLRAKDPTQRPEGPTVTYADLQTSRTIIDGAPDPRST